MTSDPIGYTGAKRDPDHHSQGAPTRRIAVALAVWLAAGCGAADGAGESASGAALEVPQLVEVAPMAGALHVRWTNHQHDCGSIQGERKIGDAKYALVFEVPGEVDNDMDATANDPSLSYTYRVRCKRGTEHSAFSNELTGTP